MTYAKNLLYIQARMLPVKNGFVPLKKFEPLNGVMFVQRTWTLTKNALERAVNRENLFLVMYCIYRVRSTIDFEVVVLFDNRTGLRDLSNL